MGRKGTALFVCAEAALYACFLVLDLLGRANWSVPVKYAGVLLCVAAALVCALRGGDRLAAPALVLTAAADWFLLVWGKHLAAGVALFLCVQALYLIRLRLAGARAALWLRMGLALLLGLGLYGLGMVSPLNLLACLYFSQLLSNAILAWTLPGRRWRMFALGLTLFVGCDVCVGLFNVGPAPGALYTAASIGMWLFYLPSQVLIVLSARPETEVPYESQ